MLVSVEGIESLCGFDEGQTEADLSRKLDMYGRAIGAPLGPIDAKLIARELTTGYVSTSMTSINIANNNLTYNAKTNKFDDMTGVKAIADALSVSTSMTSLK